MTIRESLHHAKQRLTSITENPMLDAEILLAHVLNQSRSYLHAWPEKGLTTEQVKLYAECIYRRINKEPVAYITGHREFWSLDLHVTKDTLIPRPETELLIETALNLVPKERNKHIADLGTGCGAIALALAHECPDWQIYATDISEKAIQVARLNANNLGLGKIQFSKGHWCHALPPIEFDAIISNPPYIAEEEWDTYGNDLAFEPYKALISGQDGLNSISEICRAAQSYLKKGGYLLIEHGYLQGQKVRELFADAKYENIQTLTDLLGHERATIGCRTLHSQVAR